MKKKIKLTRQFYQMDCRPSCIRMVASAYGKDYPLGYLCTLSHLTREGVSIAGMRDELHVKWLNGDTGVVVAWFEYISLSLVKKTQKGFFFNAFLIYHCKYMYICIIKPKCL